MSRYYYSSSGEFNTDLQIKFWRRQIISKIRVLISQQNCIAEEK